MGDIIMLGKLFSRSRRSAQVEELQNRLETLQEEYEKMVAEKNKSIEYWEDAHSKAVESLEKAMLRFNEEIEKVKDNSELIQDLEKFIGDFAQEGIDLVLDLKKFGDEIKADKEAPDIRTKTNEFMKKYGAVLMHKKIYDKLNETFEKYISK